MNLSQMLEASKKRREADEKTFQEHDHDLCMFCGAYGADKRSLHINCFYDIKEVAPEFLERRQTNPLGVSHFYARICKACRASFLAHLREWAKERRDRKGTLMDPDGNDDFQIRNNLVPVRIDGVIQYITPTEYKRRFS